MSRKEKSFTDRMLNQITGFILIAIVLWSLVEAKGVWDKQILLKEKELVTVATQVHNEVHHVLSDIRRIESDSTSPLEDRNDKLKKILHPTFENISSNYRDYNLGFYDKTLNSVFTYDSDVRQSITVNTSENYPYLHFNEMEKPEWIWSETKAWWKGKTIIASTVPIYEQNEVIGHAWANVKTNDVILLCITEAGKLMLAAFVIWLGVVFFMRRKLRKSFNVLNEFSRQITQGKSDPRLFTEVPELNPVLEKIEDYTQSLKALHGQCDLSNRMLDSILEGITDGLFSLNKDWEFNYLNEKAKEMFPKKNVSLVGRNIWVEYPQVVGSEPYHRMQEAMVQRIVSHWETHAMVSDQFYQYSAYPFESGLIIFVRDITEQRQMRNRLNRLASIVESTDDAIIGKMIDGVISTWNPGAQKLFGYTEEEVVGKHISILIPNYLLSETEILDAIQRGEKIQQFETIRKAKNDQEILVSLTVSPIISKSGKVIGSSTIARDITYRKEIEERLQNEINERRMKEAHFRAVFNNALLGMITFDTFGKIIRTNSTFQKMLGFTNEELNTMHLSDFTHPEDIDRCKQCIEQLLRGEIDHYESEQRYIQKDGKTIWVYVTVAISREPDVQFIIGFVQDIAEKKIMQEQMVRFDRLNLVGEMAAGISHEVRNPMTTVRGFLQMLKHKEECQNYEEYFDLMIEELDRANNIITEFLSIGRNNPTDLENVNLNTIINALVPLIEANAYGQDKYLEVEIQEIPDLLLNSKEIRQVILNLCQNGLEAMPQSGVLRIKTYCEDNKVVLSVQDEGEGIRPEVLEKLGTPFFTTKKKGTGLGLGICFSIAARHNARIDIQSDEHGTTFYVKFEQGIPKK